MLQLWNLDTEKEIANCIRPAYRFFKRLKGLMFTKSLPSGCGLHIKPCQSVHTFFMRYPIDVIYLNEEFVVVDVDTHFPPGKVGKLRKNARSVIEVPAGTVNRTSIEIGHKLILK